MERCVGVADIARHRRRGSCCKYGSIWVKRWEPTLPSKPGLLPQRAQSQVGTGTQAIIRQLDKCNDQVTCEMFWGFQRRKGLIIPEKVKGDSRGEMKFGVRLGKILCIHRGFRCKTFPRVQLEDTMTSRRVEVRAREEE